VIGSLVPLAILAGAVALIGYWRIRRSRNGIGQSRSSRGVIHDAGGGTDGGISGSTGGHHSTSDHSGDVSNAGGGDSGAGGDSGSGDGGGGGSD
jgi:hypothetical protein